MTQRTFELSPTLPRPTADFRLVDHGSIWTFHPLTAEAQQWWEEHVDPVTLRWGSGYAVEPRFVRPLVMGIEAEGFRL